MQTWRVVLELESAWIIRHIDDEERPIKVFVNACKKLFSDNSIMESTLPMECTMRLTTELQGEEIIAIIRNILAEELHISPDEDVAQVSISSVIEENSQRLTTDDTEDAMDDMRVVRAEKGNPEQKGSSAGEVVMSKINQLVGASEFKTLATEIARLAPRLIEDHSEDSLIFQNFLFVINDGEGLSTYLERFVELLATLGVMRCKGRPVVTELKLNATKKPLDDPFEEILHEVKQNVSGQSVVCIDISEWMNRLTEAEFHQFLRELEDYTKHTIFIFRIPFVEQQAAESVLENLCDVLLVRPVCFPPLSLVELNDYAALAIAKRGYSHEESVWPVFQQRIMEERSDGRFYGVNTVNKIVNEMIYRKQLYNLDRDVRDRVIRGEEIQQLAQIIPHNSRSGLDELGELIGMENIRNLIEEIVSQIELSRTNKKIGYPCMHMRFVGGPGTGKTTVARILGRILKERGLLRHGNFFECTGRDLCGTYVGETAPKTAAICRDAYGSVLFIDEAYSLYREDGFSRDYGREALETLIAEMENHRTDLLVIMAGYTDEMETLLKANPGLESRMPYEIEFPNYTREDLQQIFFKMVGEAFPYDPSFQEIVEKYFQSIPDETLKSKDFSNARFVRNLFERTCAKAAMRKSSVQEGTLVLNKEDFNLASSEHAFAKIMKYKPKYSIGFSVKGT